jgi:hypothetical protein
LLFLELPSRRPGAFRRRYEGRETAWSDRAYSRTLMFF